MTGCLRGQRTTSSFQDQEREDRFKKLFPSLPGAYIIIMNIGWNYRLWNNEESAFTARYDRVHLPFAFCPAHQTKSSSQISFWHQWGVFLDHFLSFSRFPNLSWEVKGWRVGFWEGVGSLPWWSVDGRLVPTAASSGLCVWVLQVDSPVSSSMRGVLGVCFWHLFRCWWIKKSWMKIYVLKR